MSASIRDLDRLARDDDVEAAMNLGAILSETYRRASYPATPAASDTTRLTSFINLTHRQLLGLPGMADVLRDDTLTFASVVGQASYGLPPAVTHIEAITDRTTQWRLQAMDLDDLRSSDPGLVLQGTPDRYVPRGYQQVQTQPSAATGLWAVSSSASDVQNVFIETVRTGGYQRVGAAVVLTGLSRVALGAFTDHIEVDKFYLSSAAVGAVSLFDAATAGNELARIPVGATYARYLGIQLYPTPTSVITYYVDYVRAMPDMTNTTDEPLLPEDFHWLLVEGALVKEWTKRDDTRREQALTDYNRGVSALKYFVNCPPDLLPSRGDAGRDGPSRLGGFYPRWRC